MMEDADAQLHKWNSNKSDRLEDDRIFFFFLDWSCFFFFHLPLWQGSSNFLLIKGALVYLSYDDGDNLRSLYPALAINSMSLYLCFIAAGEV